MKITMAHGSGGQTSADLMESIFAKHFTNEVLDKMEDAAVLSVSKKIAFTTDSFVVTPLRFTGGDIGKLAVCGTVNDLLMMGSVPRYITTAFILEEGLDIDLLDAIAGSVKAAAAEAGVSIVAGDTKVIEGSGGLYINTSGIGELAKGTDIGAAHCKAGDVLIVSGNLGDHHACILSARMGIANHIQSDCAPLNSLVLPLLEADIRVKAMRDITRGGLGTILGELCKTSGCGAHITESDLPVSPEVHSLCGLLGLDPLYMGNEGKMLCVVAKEDAEKALALMKKSPYGKQATIVGQMVSVTKNVEMITSIGGRRKIGSLHGEGLPRIC